MIRIGHCQLVFVHNLSEAFPESGAVRAGRSAESESATDAPLDGQLAGPPRPRTPTC